MKDYNGNLNGMMRVIINITISLVFILYSHGALAQKDALFFKHLTNANGLSSNRINTIIEDADGFIWFSTGDGLNQYDGSSVKYYDKQVTCMAIDPETKNLLVGTANGLELFDRNTHSFKHIKIQNSAGETFDNWHISDLYFDNNKQLFVGGESFFVLNASMTDFTKYELPKDEKGKSWEITSINVIKSGSVLLGTKNGVWELNLSAGKYSPVYKNKELGAIYKLFVDSKANLWICTYSKGICFSEDANMNADPIFYRQENGFLINNRVSDIVEDDDQVFLITNIDGGLVHFDKKNNKISHHLPDIHNPNSIKGKALTTIIKDSLDNIWIGTNNSGVNFIDRHRKEFEHYQINFKDDGLFNNNIRALFQDSRGDIWIGTKEGGGLSKFNRSKGTFTHYRPDVNDPSSISDDYVFCMEELDSRHLMIGTFKRGIEILDTQTGRFSHHVFDKNNIIYNRTYTIHKDLKGHIWVDHGGLFYEFFPQTRTIKKIEGIVRVKCIIDEDEDHIWLGTLQKGLFLFNTNTKEFSKYEIGNNKINALKKDTKGNLWIGTKGGLIYKKANSKEYITYTVKEGLANNQVLGLQIDDNDNVWASTTNGLSKFDTQNRKFRNYYVNDGLQGNEFEHYASLKTKEGELMFGGRNGFNIFHPDRITENPNIPKVVITDFNLFNKPVAIGAEDSPLTKHISQTKTLTLNHKQSVMTFEFVALNYSSPEKNQYAYILEGFDPDWNNIGNKREATYTNLPAGEYTLKVKASNSDGYWNNEGSSIKITILPPWWKTYYAYFLYLILSFLLLIAFYRFSLTLFNLRSNLKLEQIEKENNKALNQAKLQFFTNISHEFRTPLTLIIDPLDKLLNSNINDHNLLKHLRLMNVNANRLLRLINQLMDFRKVGKGKMTLKVAKYSLVEITEKISKSFEDKAEESSINFEVICPVGDMFVYLDLEKYDIILHNLLFNAFKFTEDYGNIKVEIGLKNNNDHQLVEIRVIDDGKGISEENVKQIFEEFYQIGQDSSGTGIGLSLTKKLVELQKGTIKVQSALGKGSCFTVSFLLGNEHFNASDVYQLSEANTSRVDENKLNLSTKNISKHESVSINNKKRPTKILLVEDNEELRNYLKETLENYYTIYEAKNGVQGIKECLRLNPDLVISDVMMPNKNGIDMCHDIKTDIRISHIPVILLTARSTIENKIEGLKTGADAYIEKPFNMRLLQVQITNILETRKKLRERFGNDLNVQSHDISNSSADERFLNKAIKIVEEHLTESDFSVEDFIKEIGMSRSSLHLKLKALTNKSTTEFIRSIRLRTAAIFLKETNQSIAEIAYKTGFASPAYFSKCFKKVFGKLPTDYRNE